MLTSQFSVPMRSDRVAGVALQVAASRDGRVIAAAAVDDLLTAVGTTARHEPSGGNDFWGVAVAPDGAVLANGRDDGTVELRDPASLAVRRTLSGLTASVLAMSFSPDGRFLAASDDVWGCG
ncbi:hypothetical protein KRMM14A1259_02250 [Krasilnikovia sp. MM14-A1259]